MHSRMFGIIFVFYLIDDNSTYNSCDNQICLQTLPNIHWGAKLPPVRITDPYEYITKKKKKKTGSREKMSLPRIMGKFEACINYTIFLA